MKDETYAFISDVKEKKVTARSARHTRTHCGKGGRVRLPSDNLSKKELMKMSGECKSYRLNEPMTREELLSMPDDLKIVYIQAIRNKYGIPDSHLAKAMGFSQQRFAKLIKRLNIQLGKKLGGHRKWDKEGFCAWWYGVDLLPTPVPEETVEGKKQAEPEIFMEDDLPVEEPDHPIRIDPIEKCLELKEENKALNTYIDELKKRIDELLGMNGELAAVHEKDKQEKECLRNECDNQRIHARILEAQMDVVRLIFGGKNNG
jgi:hypothetical protein